MQAKLAFVTPPAASPAFCVPAPTNELLAVINAPPADQEVPLYSSVQVTSTFEKPPATSPAFCVPNPANSLLAVINAPPADQEVPLYSSVQAEFVFI